MNELKQTELINIDDIKPQEFFIIGGFEATLAQIKADARSVVLDSSTAIGRKEIASLAHKIARSKTAIDGVGKEFVSLLKEKSKIVDDSRKRIRDELDALKDEIRKPLTEIEEAEEKRINAIRDIVKQLAFKSVGRFKDENERQEASRYLGLINPNDYRDEKNLFDEIVIAHENLKKHIDIEGERLSLEENQRLEMERLKIEKEEALRRERESFLIAEADKRAREEVEKKNREEILKAEREKIEAELKLEQAEKQKQKEIEDLKRKQIEEKNKADAAEAERIRLDKIRADNIENQRQINNAIKEKLMELCELDEDVAKAIVMFIIKGMVPGVIINY